MPQRINHFGASPRGIEKKFNLDFDVSVGAFNLDSSRKTVAFLGRYL